MLRLALAALACVLAFAPAAHAQPRLTTTDAKAEIRARYALLARDADPIRYRILDAHRVSRTAIAVRILERDIWWCDHPCKLLSPQVFRHIRRWVLRVIVRQRSSGRLAIPSPYL